MAATGQAPLEARALAWLAWCVALGLVPLMSGWRRAAFGGWCLGLGHFAVALHWIVEPFLVDPPRHGWMAPFALGFMAAGLALFWALALGLAAALARDRGRTAQLGATVLALTAAEMVRGVVFTGFPWASIGHIWIGAAQMQLAALAGAPGLTLLTLSTAALPALLGARRAVLGLTLGGALLGLAAGWGHLRLPPGPAPVTGLSVRVVQPNAPQDLKWHPDHVWSFFDRQLAFTAAEAPDGGPRPDVVIWPEIAVPTPFVPGDASLAQIAAAAGGSQVLVGMQRRRETGGFANMMVRLDRTGQVGGTYDKHHLVPFGEYMPLADLFARAGIFGLAANEMGGFRPGPGPAVLDLREAGRVLPLICYEAIFPGDLRAAPARADWIAQITNDAWFGGGAGPEQHLAQARLRAVEQGLPLMRAANTGISGGFDPFGRVLALLPLDTAGFADLDLPEPLPPTVYARLGDTPIFLCLFGSLLGILMVFRPVRIDAAARRP